MQDLDKAAMGRRIRQIRLGASLRQWELAKLLGTTQSAVHKYEHGVVPEPRRLVELARIGGTSIEWVLTGHHWENGSEDQARISPDLLRTACLLREVNEEGRAAMTEALRIMREAVQAVESADEPAGPAPDAYLRTHGPDTLRVLRAAWRIQQAVLRRVAGDAGDRLEASPMSFGSRDEDEPSPPRAAGSGARGGSGS